METVLGAEFVGARLLGGHKWKCNRWSMKGYIANQQLPEPDDNFTIE